MLPAETQKRHLRAPISRGYFHPENGSIKRLRFFQIAHIQDNVAQDPHSWRHGRALIDSSRRTVKTSGMEHWSTGMAECWRNGKQSKGNGVMGYSKIALRALLYFLRQPYSVNSYPISSPRRGKIKMRCPSSRYSITPFFSLRRDEFRIELIIG
jgi:hypothetical protein